MTFRALLVIGRLPTRSSVKSSHKTRDEESARNTGTEQNGVKPQVQVPSGPKQRGTERTANAEVKGAHYIAVIKADQRNAYRQISSLPWHTVAIQDSTSERGHGRVESRSIKTMALAKNPGGIAFPRAALAIRIHRRRRETGKKETRRTDYTVTSLDAHQATPADLAAFVHGQWGIENSSHHIRDVTFAEDASTVHTGTPPRAMAAFRNLATGILKILGATNIAKTTRVISAEAARALPILGISRRPNPSGT